MKWTEISGLSAGTFPTLEIIAPRLNYYFFSRRGGCSPPPFNSLNTGTSTGDSPQNVNNNRKRILESIGIGDGSLAEGRQVHGSRIETVDTGGSFEKTDGMITTRDSIALAVSTADCCPVFIYSPPENVLAGMHVGRKGAVKGIISVSMRKLKSDFLISPELSVAIMGPAICRKCYQINEHIAADFPEDFIEDSDSGCYLDLPGFVESLLKKEGIPAGNIFRSDVCTSCSPGLCYSHRRDRGITGRHWSIAFMREK